MNRRNFMASVAALGAALMVRIRPAKAGQSVTLDRPLKPKIVACEWLDSGDVLATVSFRRTNNVQDQTQQIRVIGTGANAGKAYDRNGDLLLTMPGATLATLASCRALLDVEVTKMQQAGKLKPR